ncbi:odorant receptor 179 [Nasonia vitripennis]|uniref:Odorant receptor n=1 Tax=Nasonia vitripennis TaxID=7425 RepID=A0A7M6UE08_NASVI|nr:odorant receptor 179 [Nasonia vitripennis]
MDSFDSQYFEINKRVLTICGLWPYQSKLGKRITFAMLASNTFLFNFTLIAGILTHSPGEFVNTAETLVGLFFCSTGLLKCAILYNQQNKIKKLYERIATDLKKLTDNSERGILRSFLLEGRRQNFLTMVYGVSAFIVCSCVEFLPRIFNEESEYHRPHSFPYYYRSMVIHEKFYDLQVAVHGTVIMLYSGLTYMSAIATYISSVKHVCALYEIARYRLQNAIIYDKHNYPLQELTDDTSTIPKLIKVINMHKRALRVTKKIEKVFSADFFVMEASCLIALASGIFELNYFRGNVRAIIRPLLVMPIVTIYLFFVNQSGQQVIQACNDIHTTAYNNDWYKASARVRIFVFMIMQRTLKPENLTAGSILILSIENFATILRAAWSFGTIMLTTLKHSPSRNEDA